MNTQTGAVERDVGTDGNGNEEELSKLVEMGQLVMAAQDALADPIVSRLAGTLNEGMALVDRITRNKALMGLLQELERPESQALLKGLSAALRETGRALSASEKAKGGLGALVRVAREPGAEEGLRILALVGEHLSANVRGDRRQGK